MRATRLDPVRIFAACRVRLVQAKKVARDAERVQLQAELETIKRVNPKPPPFAPIFTPSSC